MVARVRHFSLTHSNTLVYPRQDHPMTGNNFPFTRPCKKSVDSDLTTNYSELEVYTFSGVNDKIKHGDKTTEASSPGVVLR